MSYLLARLREPSTYAGIAGMLGSFGIALPTGTVQNATLLGTGLAGFLAFMIPDKKE